MNLPKVQRKYLLVASVLIVGFIFYYQETLTRKVQDLLLFFVTTRDGMLIIVVLLIGSYFAQKARERFYMEIAPPKDIMVWCCNNAPEFMAAGIAENTIKWGTFEPLIANNRLVASFQSRIDNSWKTVRIDSSPQYRYRVSLIVNERIPLDERMKLSRPEMTYDTAKRIVRDTEAAFEEKKEEV